MDIDRLKIQLVLQGDCLKASPVTATVKEKFPRNQTGDCYWICWLLIGKSSKSGRRGINSTSLSFYQFEILNWSICGFCEERGKFCIIFFSFDGWRWLNWANQKRWLKSRHRALHCWMLKSEAGEYWFLPGLFFTDSPLIIPGVFCNSDFSRHMRSKPHTQCMLRVCCSIGFLFGFNLPPPPPISHSCDVMIASPRMSWGSFMKQLWTVLSRDDFSCATTRWSEMALRKVKGNLERLFDKSLTDLVRGIRNNRDNEVSRRRVFAASFCGWTFIQVAVEYFQCLFYQWIVWFGFRNELTLLDWSVVRSLDWLIEWNWLNWFDWLIERLIDWLIDWLMLFSLFFGSLEYMAVVLVK